MLKLLKEAMMGALLLPLLSLCTLQPCRSTPLSTPLFKGTVRAMNVVLADQGQSWKEEVVTKETW